MIAGGQGQRGQSSAASAEITGSADGTMPPALGQTGRCGWSNAGASVPVVVQTHRCSRKCVEMLVHVVEQGEGGLTRRLITQIRPVRVNDGRVCAPGGLLVDDRQRVQSPPHSNRKEVEDVRFMGECVGREVYSLGVKGSETSRPIWIEPRHPSRDQQ